MLTTSPGLTGCPSTDHETRVDAYGLEARTHEPQHHEERGEVAVPACLDARHEARVDVAPCPACMDAPKAQRASRRAGKG